MKNFSKVIVTLLLFLSFNDYEEVSAEVDLECYTTASEYSFDYAELLANSDYDRICKNKDGVWLGVINVKDPVYLEEHNCMYGVCTGSRFFINFDRTVIDLIEITYNYTTMQECLDFFGWCAVEIEESHRGTKTVYDGNYDNPIVDSLINDDIQKTSWTNNDIQYDFIVQDGQTRYQSIEVISFKYILSKAEIDSLNLEIQAQYENELQIILNNDILSDIEKEAMIETLKQDYEGLHVDYGEIMESACVPSVLNYWCTAEIEVEKPLFERISEFFIRVLLIFGGMITGALILYILATLTIKQGIKTTGDIGKGTLKFVAKSGNYWVSELQKAIGEFFKLLHSGVYKIFKDFSIVFYMIVVFTIAILVLL